MALADALGVNLVETFLAFIQSDDNQRRRLLDIAGATGLLDEINDELADTLSDDGTALTEQLDPTPAPEADQASEEESARQRRGEARVDGLGDRSLRNRRLSRAGFIGGSNQSWRYWRWSGRRSQASATTCLGAPQRAATPRTDHRDCSGRPAARRCREG